VGQGVWFIDYFIMFMFYGFCLCFMCLLIVVLFVYDWFIVFICLFIICLFIFVCIYVLNCFIVLSILYGLFASMSYVLCFVACYSNMLCMFYY